MLFVWTYLFIGAVMHVIGLIADAKWASRLIGKYMKEEGPAATWLLLIKTETASLIRDMVLWPLVLTCKLVFRKQIKQVNELIIKTENLEES